MLRLWLLAHAATAAQREYRFPFDDAPIEPITSAQRESVRAAIGRCDAVWVAPEHRSAMTAATLDLVTTTMVTDEHLRTWRVGNWAGRSLQALLEEEPHAFQTWHADPDFAPARGESLSALLARTADWAESLVAEEQRQRDRRPPETAEHRRGLVIADPAVIRALIVHVLAAGPTSFWRFDVAPLGLSLAQYAAGQWRLRQLG